MKARLWREIYGGSTHFPSVLLASVVFGFIGTTVTVLSMMGAGYSGGKPLWSPETARAPALPPSRVAVSPEPQLTMAGAGQRLFLKNCAHCHGGDARGDEGPDLHNLDWTDEQIATRIRNGKKGQMPAFAGKLSPEDISGIVKYLRTLK